MAELTTEQYYLKALECFEDNLHRLEDQDPGHYKNPQAWNLNAGLKCLVQGLLQDRSDRAR